MKSIKIAVFSVMILSMLGVVQMTGCSHDDTAIVTINLTGNSSSQVSIHKSIIDRFFSFFVNDLFAGATAHVWQRDAITLTITGDGMNEMKIDIPPSQVTYSVEVPAGENRLFTVIATNLNVKNSGGSAVSSLTSGQEAQISIKMKPIVQDFFVTGGSSTATLEWSAILNISGYKIYRSTSPDGDYTLIKTINDYTTGITSDGPPSVGTYYYKMKIFDADGDGEFCDYKPATIM